VHAAGHGRKARAAVSTKGFPSDKQALSQSRHRFGGLCHRYGHAFHDGHPPFLRHAIRASRARHAYVPPDGGRRFAGDADAGQDVSAPVHPAAMPWAHWNVAVFEHIHATAASPAWVVALALVLARWTLYAALALTAWQLLQRRDAIGAARTLGAWFVSNRIEALVSHLAFQPRPFAAGYGPALMAHAANNSMPSSHVTLGLILAAVLAMRKAYRSAAAIALLTAALAWARIYVGIHWPADMLAAVLSAAVSVGAAYAVERAAAAARKRLGKRRCRLAAG